MHLLHDFLQMKMNIFTVCLCSLQHITELVQLVPVHVLHYRTAGPLIPVPVQQSSSQNLTSATCDAAAADTSPMLDDNTKQQESSVVSETGIGDLSTSASSSAAVQNDISCQNSDDTTAQAAVPATNQNDIALMQDGATSVAENDTGSQTENAATVQNDNNAGQQSESTVASANDLGPSMSTFWDHVVIPHRGKRNMKPRKKAPYNLTSEEHFAFIAEKEKTQKSAKVKARSTPRKSADCSAEKVHSGRSKSVMAGSKPVPEKNRLSVNRPEKRQAAASKFVKNSKRKKGIPNQVTVDPCLFCCESTTATACIQCQVCELWAHYECADVHKSVHSYVCELCL